MPDYTFEVETEGTGSRTQAQRGRTMVVAGLVAALVGGIIAAAVAMQPEDRDWSQLTFVIAAMIIVLLATRIGLARHRAVEATYQIVLGSDGVTTKGRLTATTHSWGAIERVEESRDRFLFVPVQGVAFELPKSAVGDEAAVSRVRSVLMGHVGGRARLRG